MGGRIIPDDKLEKSALRLIEFMEDGVLVTDINGNILKINEKFEEITGLSKDEILGKNVVNIAHKLVDKDVLEEILNIFNKIINKGDTHNYPNLTIITKDGNKRYIDLKISFTEREDGTPLNMIILNDITDMKEVEIKLKEKHIQMETLLSNLTGMAYRCLNNKDYTMKFVSEGTKELTGYEREDLKDNENVAYGDLIVPEDRDYVWEKVQSALDKDEPFKLSYRIETADGEIKWLWEQGREVTNKDGKRYLEGFITDITERIEAKDELQRSEKKVKKLHDIATKMVKITDEKELYKITLEAAKNILNFNVCSIDILENEEFEVKATKGGVNKRGDRYPIEGVAGETLKSNHSYLIEDVQGSKLAKPKRKSYRSAISVPIGDFGVFQALSEHKDDFDQDDLAITELLIAHVTETIERLRNYRKLKESKEKFKALSENSPFTIFVYRENFLYVNDASEDLTGYSKDELLNKPFWELVHPDHREMVKQRGLARVKGEDIPPQYEFKIVKKDGTSKWVYFTGGMIHFEGDTAGFGTVIDITERKEMEDAIKESKERLNLAMAVTNEGIWDWDLTTDEVYFDPRYYEMAGYGVDAFSHKLEEFKKRIHRDDRDYVIEQAEKHINGEIEKFDVEFRFKRSDGNYMWVRGRGRIVERDENGEPTRFVGTHADITERKKKEERIKHLNSLLKSIGNVNKLITQEDDILELMRKSRTLLMETRGYSRVSIFLIDDGNIYEKVGNISLDETDLKKEDLLKTKDPSVVSCEKDDICSTRGLAPLIDSKLEGILAIENLEVLDDEELGLLMEIAGDLAMAMNKIKAEKKLKRSLREKEILLDEIHHRVKNNLQVVSSLLKLQASERGNKDPLKILQEGQNRIQSMALIHEMLHRSDDMTRIELKAYIRELIRTIYQSYNISYGEVELETDMEDIVLGIDQANPCVQVINEIVSNSLQHAFPDDYEGKKKLKISTKLTDDQIIEIMISDNGVGIPGEIDLDSSETFGFRLIHMLIVDQLDGEVEVIRDGGTTFKIGFRKEGDII
ncbi:MAG: PAS domain S-box protein [Thermoplasmatota archaeon]